LIESGGQGASSVADAVREAEVIITIVPDSPDVQDVALGEDGIYANAKQGAIHVDMSSIRPDVSVELAEAGKKAGIRVVDAPVSGGEAGAREAKLSIMVGAEPADFDEVKPILEAVGTTIVLEGPPGSGQTVKAANQLIVAGNYELVAEAIVLLRAYGVDTEAASRFWGADYRQQVLDRKGPACWLASSTRLPDRPASQGHGHHLDAARAKDVVIRWGRDRSADRCIAGAGRWRTGPLVPAARRGTALRPESERTVSTMRAVDAAVKILELEGATQAFGLPGAAINPFYDAMRRHGRIRHILARHVEGASPWLRDIPGPRWATLAFVSARLVRLAPMRSPGSTASADSIPILCITGQAPVARHIKRTFRPSTSLLSPHRSPRWQSRSGTRSGAGRVPAGVSPDALRPTGPVLIDLPFDVQMAEIEFDPETYTPLPVYQPVASRAQVARL
jgi:2-hydroxy-3-oxopropionate reductase